MRWEEIIGFLAVFLNVLGNLMLTKKNIKGWTVRIVCNVAQFVYAVLISSPSLVANALIFAGINATGLVRWRRMEKDDDPVK